MGTSIAVAEPWTEKVAAFVKAEKLACAVSAGTGGTVQVVTAEGREQSDPATLRTGGWITCQDAFALAARLEIPTQSVGKLLDVLDIKLRNCQLGCF